MADDEYFGDAGCCRRVERQGPSCPRCRRPNLVAQDDGQFWCWCCGQRSTHAEVYPFVAAVEAEAEDPDAATNSMDGYDLTCYGYMP